MKRLGATPQVQQLLATGGGVWHFDSAAQAFYVVAGDQWASVEKPGLPPTAAGAAGAPVGSLARKAQFILREGLAGAMFWEVRPALMPPITVYKEGSISLRSRATCQGVQQGSGPIQLCKSHELRCRNNYAQLCRMPLSATLRQWLCSGIDTYEASLLLPNSGPEACVGVFVTCIGTAPGRVFAPDGPGR